MSAIQSLLRVMTLRDAEAIILEANKVPSLRRRGQIEGMEDRAGAKAIKATVPLSEMFGYVTSLRTLSSGRASSTMEFSHYTQAPGNVQEAVIAKVRGKVTA